MAINIPTISEELKKEKWENIRDEIACNILASDSLRFKLLEKLLLRKKKQLKRILDIRNEVEESFNRILQFMSNEFRKNTDTISVSYTWFESKDEEEFKLYYKLCKDRVESFMSYLWNLSINSDYQEDGFHRIYLTLTYDIYFFSDSDSRKTRCINERSNEFEDDMMFNMVDLPDEQFLSAFMPNITNRTEQKGEQK